MLDSSFNTCNIYNPVVAEAVSQRYSVKKVFLKISRNSLKNTSARVSFLIKLQGSACNVIKKETLAQVFSCEFCEIFKITFLYRTPPVAASVVAHVYLQWWKHHLALFSLLPQNLLTFLPVSLSHFYLWLAFRNKLSKLSFGIGRSNHCGLRTHPVFYGILFSWRSRALSWKYPEKSQ